jgi:WD40 repeat protein
MPTDEVDRDNPWPGLSSFTESQHGFFFGREKETEELVRLVRRNTLTVLFGQSGLGKSSLLQAGVFPVLRESDFLPLYLRLDHDPGAPPLVEQVKAALVAAFKEVGADAPAPRADETLWEYFHRKDIDIWSSKNRLLTPVLAFDQFEEIFTLGRADEVRRARGRSFLAELADLVENRPPVSLRAKFDSGELDSGRYAFDKPSCQVVLSLREDFLPDLEGLKGEMRSLLHSRMRLCRLSGTQALEIVTRPAPHLLAEGVAERIVEFVSGGRGGSAERLAELEVEPALLSVICRELNQRRRNLGQDTITPDLVSGNRREILTDFYERSVGDLPVPVREYVEDHLLTKSGFRDNLALEMLLEAPGVTRPLVDTLVSRRLLRIEDRLGVQRVELTHDVLADVIRASRDSRHEREALEEAKRQLTVQKEREAATRRSLVRARLIASVAIVLMLLAAGSAVFGWMNLRRARASEHLAVQSEAGETRLREEAQAQERAIRRRAYASDMNVAMQALRDGNRGHALTLINRQRPQAGQEDLRGWEWRYLWKQTRSDATATLYRNANGEIGSVSVSHDGRLLAIGSYHPGGVTIVDLTDHRRIATLVPTEGQGRSAFSPTDPLLAFTSTDVSSSAAGAYGISRLHFWNCATHQMTAEMPIEGFCNGLAFSPDGRTLVTATVENITLWRAPDGSKLAEFKVKQNMLATGTSLAISYELGLAAVELEGGRIGVVSLHDGRILWSALATNIGVGVSALAFSPDGKILATGAAYSDPDIRLWDVASGSEIGRMLGHQAWVSSLAFLPDGKRLVSSSADQTIRVWDVASRQTLNVLRGHSNEVWRLAVMPDGRTLVSGGKDGEVSLWDALATNRHRERIDLPETLVDWRFAAEGQAIFTLNQAGRVEKWNGSDYEHPETLFETAAVSDGLFSRDARQLAEQLPDGNIQIWDVARHTRLGVLKPGARRELLTYFLAHGAALVTYSQTDNREREWDVAANREILSWPCPAVPEAGGISNDERWTVTIGLEGAAWFRDLRALSSVKRDLDVLEPGGISYSADGNYFAVASYLGYVRIWDTATWHKTATLRGYRLGAHAASFSLDGRRLVTAGGSLYDTVKVWDTGSWQDVITLPGLGSTNSKTAFSADGNIIGSFSGSPHILQIWQAPSWDEIGAAEKAQSGTGANP